MVNDIFKGYLHVTKANDPDKFWTMQWVPFNNFWSSGSSTKSFKANCFVVTRAIVTDREITGGTIYWIAASTAWAIIFLKSTPLSI